MKKIILIVFASLFLMPTGFAQIQDLKEGVLVVFLQKNSRKIEALKEALEKSPDNKNLKRQLEDTRTETKLMNEAIMAAFAEEYHFSEVLFTYNRGLESMKEGEREGIYLNKALEVDKKLRLDNRFFAILKNGKAISGAEGFQILDENFEAFPNPFPQFVRLSTLSYLMNSIFADEIAFEKLYTRLAKKLQKQFNSYNLRTQ